MAPGRHSACKNLSLRAAVVWRVSAAAQSPSVRWGLLPCRCAPLGTLRDRQDRRSLRSLAGCRREERFSFVVATSVAFGRLKPSLRTLSDRLLAMTDSAKAVPGARACVDSRGQLLYNSHAPCSRRSAYTGRWLPRRPGFAAVADLVRPVIGGGDSRRTPSTSIRLHSPRVAAPNGWANRPVPWSDSAGVCNRARGGHFQSVT
jgi:hypothetical protein